MRHRLSPDPLRELNPLRALIASCKPCYRRSNSRQQLHYTSMHPPQETITVSRMPCSKMSTKKRNRTSESSKPTSQKRHDSRHFQIYSRTNSAISRSRTKQPKHIWSKRNSCGQTRRMYTKERQLEVLPELFNEEQKKQLCTDKKDVQGMHQEEWNRVELRVVTFCGSSRNLGSHL
jgi:hypothetical protein